MSLSYQGEYWLTFVGQYFLEIAKNFYNSETMVILESMQDGLLYFTKSVIYMFYFQSNWRIHFYSTVVFDDLE